MLNITDENALKNYIVRKGLASNIGEVSTRELGGGVSCSVMKVSTPGQAFVMKQALPKLKVQEDWFSDIRRIFAETECLQVYNELVPGAVPRLLFTDRDHYLFAMEAAPDSATMWKSKLLSGQIDFQIGKKVIQSLADVHNATHHHDQIQERFKDPNIYIQLRIEPYLRTVAERHPELQTEIQKEIEHILGTKQTLVHGDYSPKNILVDEERIYILDFEVAHYGDPAFDVAFLTNHLLLKSIKHKQWSPAYLNLLTYMTQLYFSAVKFSTPQLENHTVNVLSFLFLARVDGKSPAEYITDEKDKELIRNISYTIIKNELQTFAEVSELIRREIHSSITK